MGKKDIDLREYLRHVMELETEIRCQRQIVKKADEMKPELPEKPAMPPEEKIYDKPIEKEPEDLPDIIDPRMKLTVPKMPKKSWIAELIVAAVIYVSVAIIIGSVAVLNDIDLPSSFVVWCRNGLMATEIIVAAIRIPKISREKRKYKKEKLQFYEAYAKAEKEYNKQKAELEEARKKRSAERERERQNREKLLRMKQEEKDRLRKEEWEESVSQWERRCEERRSFVREAQNVAHRLLVPIHEAETTLRKLYAADILYPKYRNMAAVCTIYEYLESGRCQELEGPNGAYNLYESELRQNMIIDKLDIVIENLQNIQRNQYQLYVKLNSIETTLVSMELKLTDIARAASNAAYNTAQIRDNTAQIRDNTAEIARSAQITAFASAITAQCASIAAKNTQAIKYISLIK